MAKKKSKAWLWVSLCILGVVAFVLLLTGPHMCEERSVEAFDYNGEVEEIHLVQTDGLQGLILGEDVREDWGDGTLQAKKYSVIDLNDGRRVTVHTADKETTCHMLAGDLLWCYDEELGLHGRDPVNLEPVWDQSALHGSGTKLRGKVRKRSQDFDFEASTGRVLIKTDQGYYYYVNAKDRTLEEAPTDASTTSSSYYPTRSYADLPSGMRLNLAGNERKHLQVGDERAETSFLKGQFLTDRLTNEGLLLPGPEPNLVIAHWVRLDDSDQGMELLLSRVTPTGKELWKVDVEPLFEHPEDEDPNREIELATLVPQGLLLIYSLDNRGKLLMLDPATGTVRWKREL